MHVNVNPLDLTDSRRHQSVDTQQPSMEMTFSLHLSFLLPVSWLSLRHALPPPQGHYSVIAPAWGSMCDAIVVSTHLVACNAPMISVMKQVGSTATFPPACFPPGQHLNDFVTKMNADFTFSQLHMLN